MAFNAISVENESTFGPHDDGPREPWNLHLGDRHSGHENGESSRGSIGASAHSAGQPGAGGFVRIRPDATPGEFIRQCHQHYYFEFTWSVPFPRLPNSKLLYYPKEYHQLLHDATPHAVLDSDLDAMGFGILDQLPLAHYLLNPDDVRNAKNVMDANAQRLEEMQRKMAESGQLERFTWQPREVNALLDEEDWALVDVDYDRSLVLRRDLPSLTLLQRPLYTDLGLVSEEQRHHKRLARIIPEELRHHAERLLAPSASSQDVGRVLGASQGSRSAELESQSPSQVILGEDSQLLATQQVAGGHRATVSQWANGVSKSFRFARTLDIQFQKFLESITTTKFGLDETDADSVNLTRKIWRLLFAGTTKAQQSTVWNKLCQFSLAFEGDQSISQLVADLRGLSLPRWEEWKGLLAEYERLLRRDAENPSHLRRRRARLQLSDKELGPIPTPLFEPDLKPEKPFQRLGRDMGTNRQPLPVYPVEVFSLFPSRFDAVAEGAIEDDSALLAEKAADVHHLLLPGAQMGECSRLGGPHVLVNGNNLLLSDDFSRKPAGTAAQKIEAGASLAYHTSRENTFEPLVVDEENTGSYLFQLCSVASAQGASLLGSSGAVNQDGFYMVYDRVGTRHMYVKAPNASAPPFEQYVLVFDDEGPCGASDRGESRKRKRDRHVEQPPRNGASGYGDA